ncbi:MAG TPA: hypothetical protein PLY35_08265 [Thermotogota bacterium]|nr:hypothetical protein [Thermotogota bacterium]
MTSYITQYKKTLIEGYTNITYNKVKVGDVIKVTYPKSENNTDPHLIVLNKKYNDNLHALVLDYLAPIELKYLKQWTINEYNEYAVKDMINENIDVTAALNTLTLSVGDPKTFYETRLKNFLKTKVASNPYRTYYIKGLFNYKLVNFNWNKV